MAQNRERVVAQVCGHVIARNSAADRDQAMTLALDLAIDRAMSLVRDHDLALILALARDRDLARDHDLALALALALALTLALTLAPSEEFRQAVEAIEGNDLVKAKQLAQSLQASPDNYTARRANLLHDLLTAATATTFAEWRQSYREYAAHYAEYT